MKKQKEENRLYKYDNLKFFLIVLVILGHIIDSSIKSFDQIYRIIFVFIYSFHMPLFIFITGLFQKRIKTFKELPYKKIAWYIFLVYFMKFVLCYISIHYEENFGFSLLGGGSYYWFLAVIAFYTAITPLIEKFKFFPLLIFSLILAAFTGYDASITNQFQLSRIIVFFPFYLTGYKLSSNKEKIITITNKKIVKLISLILIGIFIYLICNNIKTIYPLRYLFSGSNPFSAFPSMNFTYETRITTYFISYVIGFAVLTIIPNKKIPIISKSGTKTLQIYVLHRFILILLSKTSLFDVVSKMNSTYATIIIVIISLIITVLLSFNFITKIFDYVKNNLFVSKAS